MDINYNDVNYTCNCQGRGGRLNPDQINEILNEMFEDYISGGTLEQYIINAMADTYTQDQINAMLSDMATMTWVEAQGYLTEHQSLDGLATDADLANVYNMIANLQTQINACCSGDTPVETTGFNINIVYNVTSTTEPTSIISDLTGVESIKYGGNDIPLAVSYIFPATGPQTLVFKFPTVVPAEKWREADNILSASIEKNVALGYCEFGESPITSVTFAAGHKTPMTTQFFACTALTQVNGLEDTAWEILPIYIFSGCTSLSQDIILPSTLRTIERQALAYAPIRNLTIDENIQYIGKGALSHITGYVRFLGTTPPSIDFGADGGLVNFTGNYPIYVPSSAVNAYKTAYPNLSNRIQAWS